MKDYNFPNLSEPYDSALKEAVRYISGRFELLGIMVTGSIIRRMAHKNSDFDIFVIHNNNFRQRIQKFFKGIPAEIFVNPPVQIEKYYKSAFESGKPDTQHMFATGFIIFDKENLIRDLQEKGK